MTYGFLPHFLCSGTVATFLVLGDYPDHHRAWELSRPLSCSGTASTTFRPLLGDHSPRLHVICTHIQLRGIYFFSLRPCYKADISPSSKLGDYIGTMHLPVHLVSLVRRLDFQLNWEFFLTLAPRACVTYYQARGLSGHTSPCGECVYFIDPYALTVDHNCYCTRVTYISF